jgi:hypothetical protein
MELALWLFLKFEARQAAKIYMQRAVVSDAASSNLKKNAPNGHFNLQRTVVPDWITQQEGLKRAGWPQC